MGEINIARFSGANNVKIDERFYSNVGAQVAEPRVILNADVDPTGKLRARMGKTLFISLAGAHSMWAGNTCQLCAAGGILYRIQNEVATQVGNVVGPKYPLSYIDADDKVYISNPYWQGIFDPVTNAISAWGIPLPPGPTLLSGDGGLPAGTYNVCMTNVVNGQLSGNGPIATINLAAPGGIQIINRPAGALVWVTDANEHIFYSAGAVSQVSALLTVEPLPSFLCSPPPYMENLCYAFGRIWGSVGPVVYYCQPFQLGWYRLASNQYAFEDTVTMIAKVSTGLFIGMKHRTKFLAGTEPEKMALSDAGAGSVKGTLVYCNNMPELGWTLGTPEKDFVDVPVWVTAEGIVVGAPTGKFFNITKNKIKMSIPTQGASLYRNSEGFIQFLTSFKSGGVGSGVGVEDLDTFNAFKAGRIDTHSRVLKSEGSLAGFSDDASCTVTRGGVQI